MKLGVGLGAGLGDGGYVEGMNLPTAATSLFRRINVEAKMATVGRAITQKPNKLSDCLHSVQIRRYIHLLF